VRRAAAWIAVAPWVAWALARVLGLESGYPLVPIMAFAPYAAVAGLVAAGVAIALRGRLAAALSVVAAVVLALGVIPRAHADGAVDDGARPGPHLRVLTLNAHLGGVPAEDVVALVRRFRVDVLSVQELTPELDRALVAAGLLDRLPHRVAEPRFGGAGTGLFTRFPIADLRGPTMINPAPAAVVSIPGAPPAEFYAIHASAPFSARQTARWGRDLRALPEAASPGALRILAGDFNATLDHAELRRVLATGYQDAAAEAGAGLHPTWPFGRRRLPPVTIDHVLADERCGVGEVRTLHLRRSDHRALLAELVLPAR
jgi:endonuclease/exonuclease/phosphatase (EEP) superfamily protein YafD